MTEILLIEDDLDHAQLIERGFTAEAETTNVRSVQTLSAARDFLQNQTPDLIIADHSLPDGQGLELALDICNRQLCPIILLTAQEDDRLAFEALESGMADFLRKSPAVFQALPAIAQTAIRSWQHMQQCRQAEQAVRHHQEEMTRILDASPEAIIQLDVDFNIEWVNRCAEDLLQIPRNDVESDSGRRAWDEEFHGGVNCPAAAALESGDTEEGIITSRDGRIWRIRACPIHDKDDQVTGVITYSSDVTAEKRSQAALKQSEAKYRSLYESSKDGIIFVDMELQIIDANQSFLDMLGYSKEELRRMNCDDFTAEQFHAVDRAIIEHQVIPRGYSDEVEKTFIRRDGNTVPATMRAWLLRDNHGLPVGMWAFVRDITPQRETQDKLRQLSKVFMESTDPIFLLDLRGDIIDLNHEAERIHGYDRSELIGKSIRTVVYAAEQAKSRVMLARCLRGRPVRSVESRLVNKAGRCMTMLISFSLLTDDVGNPVAVACNSKDVTHLQQAQRDLEIAKEEAEKARRDIEKINRQLELSTVEAQLMAEKAQAANAAKSNFLANMSHEIRTPMNAIIGFSELLAQDELQSEQADQVQAIRQASSNLLGIINDILDFSKIEAGKLQVEQTPTVLGQIIQDVDKMLRPQAHAKDLQFHVEYGPDVPRRVKLDPGRVRQCLVNLVNNAIKFTKEGHVRLGIDSARQGDQHCLMFTIEDTGIGIPPEMHTEIFESFSQVDGSNTRAHGGTGLGLAITKRLVDILGGEITLTSTIGQGTTFNLKLPVEVCELPFSETAETPTHDGDSANSSGLRGSVLVAEDNHANQQLMRILLKRWQLDHCIAHDGKEAVDLALAQNFDVIIMDIQMPRMTGLEATAALREKGVQTPIIALTAHAMHGDSNQCFDVGCNDYLSKPVNQKALYKMLEKHLSQSDASTPQEATSPAASSQSATPAEPVADAAAIVSELAADPDLCAVAELFIEEVPQQFAALQDALDKADLDQLKRVVHDLKGASGNAGFPTIMDAAADVEKQITPDDIDALREQVDQLHAMCRRASAQPA